MDQVHLAQVGLGRVTGYSRAMLNRLARMRVSFDTQAGQEPNAILIRLDQSVCRAAVDGRY